MLTPGHIGRTLILILLLVGAVRCGWYVYHIIYDLLALQLHIYEWFLQTQYTLAVGQEEVQNIRIQALEFLGKEQHAEGLPPENTIQEQLNQLQKRIQIISLIIASVGSMFLWHIGFSIVFRVKKYIHDIRSFVGE